jgi:predicted nucleotidyltransferase
MDKDKTIILKVLVGSRAHRLHNIDSDYDYRGVYVLPTSKILSLDYKYKTNEWIEGGIDNTSYEIGHFLKLAVHCNPSILEVFKAPIIEANKDGYKLRELFHYIWNPRDAFDAFTGYSHNQRKKFLDKKDARQNKYAIAYIRTLVNLIDLLEHKTFDLKVNFLEKELRNFKRGYYKMGDVINLAEGLINMAKDRLEKCKHESDIDKVNAFLIDIRRRYW